jgi:hypothetical protein
LYESFYPGPDQERVGEVAGVVVYAPEYLRTLYPGDEGVVIDAVEVPAVSMSIETEWGWRLILRGFGVDTGTEPDGTCTVAPRSAAPREASIATGGPSRVRGELPDTLSALAARRHRR